MSEFDRELMDALDAPDDGTSVNPWSRPILLITWGILLTTITFNFLGLQYILTTVGMALMYLGFRALRRENRYFRAAYILAAVRAAAQSAFLIGSAADLAPAFQNRTFFLACVAVQIAQLVCFKLALDSVFTKCGAERNTASVGWLIGFTVSFGVLGVIGVTGGIVLFIYAAIYAAVVLSLVKISSSLSFVGYSMVTAPVKLSDTAVFLVYTIGTAAVTFALLIGSSITLSAGAPFEAPADSPLRESLIEGGFPDYVLQDLDDETVAHFDGFVKIQSTYSDYDYTKGANLVPQDGDFERSLKYLRLTTVYVELEGQLIYTVNHFIWLKGSSIWGDYVEISGDDNMTYGDGSLISSSIMYEKGGETYVSELSQLSDGYSYTTSFFVDTYQIYRVTGFARFPVGCRNARGYVVMAGSTEPDLILVCNVFNYYPTRFPAYPSSSEADYNRLVQNYSSYETSAHDAYSYSYSFSVQE